MIKRFGAIVAGALLAGIGFQGTPGHALTMKECGAKYREAQAEGRAKGVKWSDFRKANCGTDASTTTATTTTSPPGVVFPTTISARHSRKSPARARMHTCLDQYKANRATGGNGDLKWIRRSGGYFFECNQRLKG